MTMQKLTLIIAIAALALSCLAITFHRDGNLYTDEASYHDAYSYDDGDDH
jgi:hypothetical protein